MAILQDPVMQSILQQAKGDPAALQDHMKNADIRSKVGPAQSTLLPCHTDAVLGAKACGGW